MQRQNKDIEKFKGIILLNFFISFSFVVHHQSKTHHLPPVYSFFARILPLISTNPHKTEFCENITAFIFTKSKKCFHPNSPIIPKCRLVTPAQPYTPAGKPSFRHVHNLLCKTNIALQRAKKIFRKTYRWTCDSYSRKISLRLAQVCCHVKVRNQLRSCAYCYR